MQLQSCNRESLSVDLHDCNLLCIDNGCYNSCVTGHVLYEQLMQQHQLMEKLCLQTLNMRRSYLKQCHLYKLVHGLPIFPNSPITTSSSHSYPTRSIHHLFYMYPPPLICYIICCACTVVFFVYFFTSGYILKSAPLLLFMYPLSFGINYYIQKNKLDIRTAAMHNLIIYGKNHGMATYMSIFLSGVTMIDNQNNWCLEVPLYKAY